MASGKTSKNSRVDKKKVTFEKVKREREKKETSLYPVSVYEPEDGKINGKEVIGQVRKYGKCYWIILNK